MTDKIIGEQGQPLAPTDFLRRSAFSMPELMMQQFPPVAELVPGIVSCGLVLLVSAPKLGKSWFSLGLAYAAASGGRAFEKIPMIARPVLYMALEDGPRRLQDRLIHMGHSEDDAPEKLFFRVRLKPNETPLTVVESFFHAFAGKKPLVILDTLGKVLSCFPQQGKEGIFEHDYRIMSQLKEVVDRSDGGTLLIVHHTRKDNAGDFMDSVSGTNAIAGAADTIMRLNRRRGENDGVLEVTSRDNQEGEYAITFDSEHGLWLMQGADARESAAAVERRRLTNGVGNRMAKIVDFVGRQSTPVNAQQVAEAVGGDSKLISTYLGRAYKSGLITKSGHGDYAPLGYGSVECVGGVETGGECSLFSTLPTDSTRDDSVSSPGVGVFGGGISKHMVPLWWRRGDCCRERDLWLSTAVVF
ncbi:AAA family ATPase [Bifidobacterium sp. 82T10]|uniref:AAA family ATPase n=1 Tax=Bifidobacterium miconis TaxID=2834435 RepID=A0ABS6WF72_9BIFI|nr:AAA family ATPase [Bifidobacterium miconis]MBW3092395.1 AAA family ATPase [Bifidobacterium miconis]